MPAGAVRETGKTCLATVGDAGTLFVTTGSGGWVSERLMRSMVGLGRAEGGGGAQ